jgi:phosphatidylglycerophosphatase A
MHGMIATFFGVGRLPAAPGTFGSLAAIPLGVGLHWIGGFPALALGVVVACVAGWWATAAYLEQTGAKDPGEVVIDEVAGQLLALAPMSWAFWSLETPIDVMPYPAWIAAFLLFRAFDILKPPPVSWAERPAGATGVMLDDLVAGALAGACSVALGLFWHVVLM